MRTRAIWGCLLIIAVTLLAIYAGLPIYASVWHLFHGSSVRCGEFTIPVPAGWWARDGGCSLVTPSPAYTLKTQAPTQMFFNLLPTPSVNDSQWRGDVVAQLQRDGNIFEGTKELAVAAIPTVCFQYRTPSKPRRASTITCNVDRRMVVTFFYDDPKLANDFYKILSGIQDSRGVYNPSTPPK
jgi:hypothetical protein